MFAPSGVDSESSDEDVSPITSPSASPTRAKFSFKSLFIPPKSHTPPLAPLTPGQEAVPDDNSSDAEPAVTALAEQLPVQTHLQRLKRRVRILAKGDTRPTTNKGESAVDEVAEADEGSGREEGKDPGANKEEEKDPAAVQMLALLRQLVAQQQPPPAGIIPPDLMLSPISPMVPFTSDSAAVDVPAKYQPVVPMPTTTSSEPLPPPVIQPHAGRDFFPTHTSATPLGLNDTYNNPERYSPGSRNHHIQLPPHSASAYHDYRFDPHQGAHHPEAPPFSAPPWQTAQYQAGPHPRYDGPFHPPPMYPHPSALQPWHPSQYTSTPQFDPHRYAQASLFHTPSQPHYPASPVGSSYHVSNMYGAAIPTPLPSSQAPGYPFGVATARQDSVDPRFPWSPTSPLANPWDQAQANLGDFLGPTTTKAVKQRERQSPTPDIEAAQYRGETDRPSRTPVTLSNRNAALNEQDKSASTRVERGPTRPLVLGKTRKLDTPRPTPHASQERPGASHDHAVPTAESTLEQPFAGMLAQTGREQLGDISRPADPHSKVEWTTALVSLATCISTAHSAFQHIVRAQKTQDGEHGQLAMKLFLRMGKALAAGNGIPDAFAAVLGDRKSGDVFSENLSVLAAFLSQSVSPGVGTERGTAEDTIHGEHGILQLILSNDRLGDLLHGWPLGAYVTPGIISIIKGIAVKWKNDDLSLKVILRSVLAIRKELDHPTGPIKGSGLLDQLAVILSKQLRHQSSKVITQPNTTGAAPLHTLRPSPPDSISPQSTSPKAPPPRPKPAAKPPVVKEDSSDSAYSGSEPASPGTMESDDEADHMLAVADSGPPVRPVLDLKENTHKPGRNQVKAAREVLLRK